MKTILRGTCLTLVLVVLASSAAMADGERVRPARANNPFSKVMRCLQIVDLSDDQRTEIRSIFEAAKPNLSALAADLRADRDALRALVSSDTPDECAVGAALLEVEAAAQILREETAIVMDSVKAILSPEQQAMLEGCLLAPRDSSHGED